MPATRRVHRRPQDSCPSRIPTEEKLRPGQNHSPGLPLPIHRFLSTFNQIILPIQQADLRDLQAEFLMHEVADVGYRRHEDAGRASLIEAEHCWGAADGGYLDLDDVGSHECIV